MTYPYGSDRYNLFVFERRDLRIIYGPKRDYSSWTDNSNKPYKLYIVFSFSKLQEVMPEIILNEICCLNMAWFLIVTKLRRRRAKVVSIR
jgi:hypothetical protein